MLRVAMILLLCCCTAFAHGFDTNRKDVAGFIDEMVDQHGFERAAVVKLLAAAESQESILEAISRPAERTKPWHEYRDIFITDKRIKAGAAFWREHEAILQEVCVETGIPIEILVGIIGVETYYGRITGKYKVVDALATLAFDYPPRKTFFRNELVEFLLLAREEKVDTATVVGSYAGAMGPPQFMPSSYRAYAVDNDKDGQRNLFTSWRDVIGSVANYFQFYKWRSDEPVVAQATLSEKWRGDKPDNSLKPKDTVASLSKDGVLFVTDLPADSASQLLALEGKDEEEFWVGFHNFFVITRYNRSVMYALAVHQLGQEIALEVKRASQS